MSRKAETRADRVPALTGAEQQASPLRISPQIDADERIAALESEDPFIRQAAIAGLINANQLAAIDPERVSSPQRVGLMSAWRWKELCDPTSLTAEHRLSLLRRGLQDESADVVLTALRWAAERRCKELLPAIQALLRQDHLSPQVFSAAIGSIAYLETGTAAGGKRDPAMERLLVELARDADRSPRLRGLAVQRIPGEADVPRAEELSAWLNTERDRAFSFEVVRLLAERGSESARKQLVAIAGDVRCDPQTRADALAGLLRKTGDDPDVVGNLSAEQLPPVLQTELERVRAQTPTADQTARPGREDLDAWSTLVGSGGEAEAGRRVFVRRGCSDCHMHANRGARTGPDLTGLAGHMTRRRALESILQPSKEVGPLYVPWLVQTIDGRMLTGLKLDAAGVGGKVRFQGADSRIFELPLNEIESQTVIGQSIMPTGLEETMTLDELRDLVTFLTGSS